MHVTANTGTGKTSHSSSSSSSSEPICFYNKDEKYYEFTNFFPSPIELDGKQWPTTEHYFQAQKFIGTSLVEVIRQKRWARDVFEFAQKPDIACQRRKDWDKVKIQVMKRALVAKFTQHDSLCQLLVDTGTRKLVERSPYDTFWGDGGDGSGKNQLGKLLMEVREELRSTS